jgi:hypothetical protein
MDPWKEEIGDTDEIALKKKALRWEYRHTFVFFLSLLFAFLYFILAITPPMKDKLEMEKKELCMAFFMTFALICQVYSLDFFKSETFRNKCDSLLKEWNTPVYFGPVCVLVYLVFFLVVLIDYLVDPNEKILFLLKLIGVFLLFLCVISYEGFKKTFS